MLLLVWSFKKYYFLIFLWKNNHKKCIIIITNKNYSIIIMNEKNKWEDILKKVGLGEDLPPEFPGEKIDLGDGLGRKTEKEERTEDGGKGHSRMCPLNLKGAMNDSVDQPHDDPVFDKIAKKQGF